MTGRRQTKKKKVKKVNNKNKLEIERRQKKAK
jgi:hypothetical protein